MNKKDAANRKHVLFINADREYREGKAQNFLRPEDISQDRPRLPSSGRTSTATPRCVPVSEIAAEDFNCNIRRYVDNAPPPEPHDVRAHLHGGVPVVEIDALGHFWTNYPGLRERVFVPATANDITAYCDFTPAVTDRRALADLVKNDPSVAKAHARFLETLETWWQEHLPLIEALAPDEWQEGQRLRTAPRTARHHRADLRRADPAHRSPDARRVRALRRDLKADLKSIAASGWGPELIPDDDILESQFPEVLAEMEQKRLRLAELSALFAAADEEDYEDSDDTGVLARRRGQGAQGRTQGSQRPGQAGESERQRRLAAASSPRPKQAEKRLAEHKALEDEARQLKADLRATEKKQEELVAAAREKIDRDEARRVILDRLHRLLVQTYEGYLRADQRACLAALENLHAKYAVTAKSHRGQTRRRSGEAEKLPCGVGV